MSEASRSVSQNLAVLQVSISEHTLKKATIEELCALYRVLKYFSYSLVNLLNIPDFPEWVRDEIDRTELVAYLNLLTILSELKKRVPGTPLEQRCILEIALSTLEY